MARLISPIPRENTVSKKIRELSEKVPGASWILPDPYDPTSYIMPIGGVAKEAFIQQITKLIGESPQIGKFTGILPKKILQKIREVRSVESLPEMFRKKLLGAWWPGEKTLHLSPKAGLDVVSHEVGHIAEDIFSKGQTLPIPVSEAVADYVGRSLGERSGLSRRPRFFGGDPVYAQTLQDIRRVGSKNPWMNVYRYLKTLR